MKKAWQTRNNDRMINNTIYEKKKIYIYIYTVYIH